MWGSCFSRLVDGKSGVVKCKVGRGRSDWFTLKVFGDARDMVSANNFVVEVAKS